jgi:putative transposase
VVIEAEKANYPLALQVARVFEESRQTSGCRRVAAQLGRDGHEASVGMVVDLMRELGLAAVQPRAYKRTTVPGEHPVPSPDLIGRDFTATEPALRLVGDITYLPTGQGWLYLATVLDLGTWLMVGWQMPPTCARRWSWTFCRWPSTVATSGRTRSSTSTP